MSEAADLLCELAAIPSPPGEERGVAEVALRYLEQPEVSLVRVTEILGYSETSVLSRSCHRWFCASPRELRNGLNR